MTQDFGKKCMDWRYKNGGPLFTGLKDNLETKTALSTHYTPGIAEPCKVIAKDRKLASKLTTKKNTIAVVSDGSAVLGLGNIGPEAGLPVMEGKSMLFKKFGNVDAVPIVLNTQDTEAIIQTITHIAPGFAGINLEDISAPRCFEIEKRLSEKLDIPVFHDDQHGTAMVVLAGLINALKITKKSKETVRVVIGGAGAGGLAIAQLLKSYGFLSLDIVDSKGLIHCERKDLNQGKKEFCTKKSGSIQDALIDADIFIGVSRPQTVTSDMIASMNSNPIVFAMANPIPEIYPEEAKKGGAKIIATGRSDFPNQINNVLIFPGFFRGLIDSGQSRITKNLKISASDALAKMVKSPHEGEIIPSPLDLNVAPTIAKAVIDYFDSHPFGLD